MASSRRPEPTLRPPPAPAPSDGDRPPDREPEPGRQARLGGALAAEAIGTFLLLFVGTGTVVAVTLPDPDGAANLATVSIAFGVAVVVAVYAFGPLSGAHINPTVTVALAAVGRFPWRAVAPYLAAQLTGGVLGSLSVWALFGADARAAPLALGATAPNGGTAQAFLAEVVLGFLLMVVVSSTALDPRAVPGSAGVSVGLVVAGGVFATAGVSGGSFNAVRALAPMLVSGELSGWWLYLVAPAFGGVAGAWAYRLLAPATPAGEAVEPDASLRS